MIDAEPLYSLTTTAQMYSQIAGVLAGFAFTALLGYIRRDQAGSGAVTIVLFFTMAALVMCAILYGVLAGGEARSGSSYSGLIVVGPTFGLAIATMFYATGLAARPFEHLKPVTAAVRVLVGLLVPGVVMFLLAAAALDVFIYRCRADRATALRESPCDPQSQLNLQEPTGLGFALGVAVLIVAATGLVLYRRPRSHPPKRTPVLVSVLVLSASVASTVGLILVSWEPDYTLPDTALIAILVVTATLLLIVGIMAARSCHHVPDAVIPGDLLPTGAAALRSPGQRTEMTIPVGVVLIAGAILVWRRNKRWKQGGGF